LLLWLLPIELLPLELLPFGLPPLGLSSLGCHRPNGSSSRGCRSGCSR
jgi:hypothetical protein